MSDTKVAPEDVKLPFPNVMMQLKEQGKVGPDTMIGIMNGEKERNSSEKIPTPITDKHKRILPRLGLPRKYWVPAEVAAMLETELQLEKAKRDVK